MWGLEDQPVWLIFVVIAVLAVVGYAVVRGVFIGLDRAYGAMERFIERAMEGFGNHAKAGTRGLKNGATSSLRIFAALILLPFTAIYGALDGAYFAPRRERLRADRELRQKWQEFRDVFPRFEDFKKWAESPEDASGASQPEHQENPFQHACSVLELDETGNFSFEDFQKRYRKLRSAMHPDKEGSRFLFVKIEEAAAEIRKAKNWS